MSKQHSQHIDNVNILKRKFAVRPHQVFNLTGLVISLLASINIILIFVRYGLQYNSTMTDSLFTLFDLDNEHNVPTYWSSLLLLTAALLLTYIFIQKYLLKEKYRFHWLMLAGIFLFMSMDEYMALHERMIKPLRSLFDAGGWLYFSWVIPAFVVVGIIGFLFFPFILSLRAPIRNMFFLSGIIYLGGVLGVEMLSGYITYNYGQRSLLYPMTTTVEETLEMFGVAYFIYALLTYIQADLDQKMKISFRKKNSLTDNPEPSLKSTKTDERRFTDKH